MDESRLRELEAEYLREVAPDATSYLEMFRGTILRFHLAGHSRQSTYRFLSSRKLIGCSQATFYRWLTANIDFKREALELRARATDGNEALVPSAIGRRAEARTEPSNQDQAVSFSDATGGIQHAPLLSPSVHPGTSPNEETSSRPFKARHQTRPPALDSALRPRATRLNALDEVMDRMSRESKEAVAARALGRLRRQEEGLP